MHLVIDANILVAALLKEATTRVILLEEDMEFFAPECLLNEVKGVLKNPRVRRRIPLNDKDLSDLTSAVFSHIVFFPEKIFAPFIKRAILLVTHIEDAPYFALSLALKLPLWSNDLALKDQSLVKVYTTTEILKLLKNTQNSHPNS